jgi:LysM repeat protein
MSFNRIQRSAVALACLAALAGSAIAAGDATNTGDAVTAPTRLKITAEQIKLAHSSKNGVDVKSINADAPASYTVKPGDTLWRISSVFLKSPWLWPALWGMNMDDVKNPHLIYPGEILNLSIVDGKATLSRGGLSTQEIRLSPAIRVEDQISKAITTIPQSVIAPFLTKPFMVENEIFTNAGFVHSSKDNRLNIGTGGVLYATAMPQDIDVGESFYIFRPGRAVDDTSVEDGKTVKTRLGVEAVYLGEAQVVRKNPEGTISMEVVRAEQEIGKGDRLLRMPKENTFRYVPHPPSFAINARVVMMHDGRTGSSLISAQTQSRSYETEGGKFSIIVLNRGANDGLESGHVLELVRPAHVTAERSSLGYREGNKVTEAVKLPAEKYGSAMVFKTFSKVSYAIVMGSETSVMSGDEVVTPGLSGN